MTVSPLFFKTPMQGRTFLLLMLAGALSALLFGTLILCRKCLPRSVGAACDVLFWCSTAALIALALSFGGEGQLRWYAFFGAAVGGGVTLCLIRLVCAPFRRLKKQE